MKGSGGQHQPQNITTIAKQYSTNPFQNIKTYNPFENRQENNNKRKESEEIHHDQPILENLLRRGNSTRSQEDHHNEENAIQARPRGEKHSGGALAHCDSCGDHAKDSGKIVRVIREFLHPENAESFIKIFFNLLVGAIVCAIFIMAFITIKEDLHKKRAHEMEVILLEIGQCTKDYVDNRCEPEKRLPAVEEYCLQTEKCMSQDPMKVIQSSKMTAALVAEIINEFIDPLGFKAIGVFFVFFVSFILFNRSFRNSKKHAKDE